MPDLSKFPAKSTSRHTSMTTTIRNTRTNNSQLATRGAERLPYFNGFSILNLSNLFSRSKFFNRIKSSIPRMIHVFFRSTPLNIFNKIISLYSVLMVNLRKILRVRNEGFSNETMDTSHSSLAITTQSNHKVSSTVFTIFNNFFLFFYKTFYLSKIRDFVKPFIAQNWLPKFNHNINLSN